MIAFHTGGPSWSDAVVCFLMYYWVPMHVVSLGSEFREVYSRTLLRRVHWECIEMSFKSWNLQTSRDSIIDIVQVTGNPLICLNQKRGFNQVQNRALPNPRNKYILLFTVQFSIWHFVRLPSKKRRIQYQVSLNYNWFFFIVKSIKGRIKSKYWDQQSKDWP